MDKHLLLNDDHLVAYFPYDKEAVDEIKKIHGAKWDKLAKAWRVPMHSIVELRDFATKHEFTIDPQVLTFDLPEPLNPAFGVRLDGDFIYLSFAYDPVKVRAVKQIPSVTWHAKTKAWRAPLNSIAETLMWAEKFGEKIPEDLNRIASEIKIEHEKSVLM